MADLVCPVCRREVPYPPGDGNAIREAIQDMDWVSIAFVFRQSRYAYTVCSFECAARLFGAGPPELHEEDPGLKRRRQIR